MSVNNTRTPGARQPTCSQSVVINLRRAVALRDQEATRAIGLLIGRSDKMLRVMWRAIGRRDHRGISFVSNCWDGIGGWWR